MAVSTQSRKTNEHPGTRSQIRYARMSASKVRVVLNLIRHKHVVEAIEILTFSERLAAKVIDKCLRAAVANAVHNDEIPTEELYVSACYADEGPTLKRYRPRARGRAGRIHKQTCHITIVVSRYSEDELDEQRRRAELRGQSGSRTADASAERARRVARSRAADADEPKATEASDTVEEVSEAEVAKVVADTMIEDTVEEIADASTALEATEVAPATSSDELSDGATEVAEKGVADEAVEDTVDDVAEDVVDEEPEEETK